MHDALMAGGKGKDWLREIGCEERAIEIIDLITPPPHGDYFRALEAITPEDNTINPDYVHGPVGAATSGPCMRSWPTSTAPATCCGRRRCPP